MVHCEECVSDESYVSKIRIFETLGFAGLIISLSDVCCPESEYRGEVSRAQLVYNRHSLSLY